MNDTETPAPSRETLGSGATCYTLSANDEVVDSIVVCDVVLNLDNLINDTLMLPDELLAVLGESSTYIVALHQPGAELAEDEYVQRVTRDGSRLVGITWPLSFHDAVTVSVTRGGCRVRVDDLAYVGR
jgi:hypothetical protein